MAKESPNITSQADRDTPPALISLLLSIAKREWIVIAVASGAFIWAIAVSALLFPFLTNNHDEPVYILQAKYLLEGKLYLNSDEFSEFFTTWFFIDDGEKIFSKYMPVHAALLAFGQLLSGSMRTTLGCVAAANVILFYILAREFHQGRFFAHLAMVFFVMSPLFLIQSATFLSYMTGLLFNLTFAVLLLRGIRKGSMYLLLGSGFALGISIIARPFDAALFMLPFALLFLKGQFQDMKHTLRKMAYVGTGLILPLSIGMLINVILTGNLMLFPFTLYEPLDTLGFGTRRQDPTSISIAFDLMKGITGVGNNLLQLSLWVFGGPLLICLGLLGIILSRWTTWKIIAVLLLVIFPAANIFFWGSYNVTVLWNGVEYLGPFYYIPMLIPIILLGTWGLARIWDWRPLLAIGIISIMLVLNIRLTLNHIELNYAYTQENRTIYQPFIQTRLVNSLVFVPTIGGEHLLHPFALLANNPSLDGPILYALNKGNENFVLLEEHRTRTPYRFVYQGLYTEGPYDDIKTDLVKMHMVRVANYSLPIHIVNPTDKPFVFTYVWNGEQTTTYILDDSSEKGSTYEIVWDINPDGAALGGPIKSQLTDKTPLSADNSLNIAVAFADTEIRTVQDIFEWRFWFQITEDHLLDIALPPEGWHNPGWPELPWRMEQIDYVMTLR